MPIVLDGTAGIDNDATDLSYTGTLTGGTGVVNLGSGQVYKDASGNVGIGTSSPGGKLAVTTAAGGTSLVLTDATNSTLSIKHQSPGNLLTYETDGTASQRWVLNSAERARIDSDGSFLVGTTTTVIENASNFSVFKGTTRTTITVNHFNSNAGDAYARFGYNGVQVGSITIVSGGTTVAYNTSSDYRLKENVQPMIGALARVAALKPCTYTWKSTGEADDGFIAHELAEVCPSAVTGEKDAVDSDGNPQYQGIDTSFLVATLTAALQEQQAIIESLTARVVALEQA